MKTKSQVLVLLVLLALAVLASRAAEDAAGLKSVLPPPEFYTRHKDSLNLTQAQGQSLREVLDTMNRDFRAAQADLTARSRELEAAVENASLPADEVTRKLHALLQAENRAKEIRFNASLAARRLLTDEQWQKTRTLAAAAAPPRARTGPTADMAEEARMALQQKLERVRALSSEVFPDGPSPEFRRRFEELKNKVRSGQTADADKLFDQLIAELEKRQKR